MPNESGGDDDYVLDDLRRHPRVCANCFRFRHDADPVPEIIQRKANSGSVWAQAVIEPWHRTAGMHTDAPMGDTVSEWAERTVCHCGAVSTHASLRDGGDPLSFNQVVTLCQHIDDTLGALVAEYLRRGETSKADRYAHDPDVLFDVARHLKSKPDNQFRDDTILSAATEIACRRGTADDHATES